MDLTHIKDIFQCFAVGLLIAIIVWWILVAIACGALQRRKPEPRPDKLVKRQEDEYLDWLERAVERDREYGSGVNRME